MKFDLFAQQATLEDYLAEVLHASERIHRLEQRIDPAARSDRGSSTDAEELGREGMRLMHLERNRRWPKGTRQGESSSILCDRPMAGPAKATALSSSTTGSALM